MRLLMGVKAPCRRPAAQRSTAGTITSLNTPQLFSIALKGEETGIEHRDAWLLCLCDTNYHHITIQYLLFSLKMWDVLCNDLQTEYQWHFRF